MVPTSVVSGAERAGRAGVARIATAKTCATRSGSRSLARSRASRSMTTRAASGNHAKSGRHGKDSCRPRSSSERKTPKWRAAYLGVFHPLRVAVSRENTALVPRGTLLTSALDIDGLIPTFQGGGQGKNHDARNRSRSLVRCPALTQERGGSCVDGPREARGAKGNPRRSLLDVGKGVPG